MPSRAPAATRPAPARHTQPSRLRTRAAQTLQAAPAATEPSAAAQQDAALAARLRQAGLQPTRQRLAMARVLLTAPIHMHADQVLQAARQHYPSLSRATVYASLPLFAERGLLRALPLGLEHTVYDSCTEAHPHLLMEDSGEVVDLPPDCIRWDALPPLAPGLEVAAIDMVVRVRRTAT